MNPLLQKGNHFAIVYVQEVAYSLKERMKERRKKGRQKARKDRKKESKKEWKKYVRYKGKNRKRKKRKIVWKRKSTVVVIEV